MCSAALRSLAISTMGERALQNKQRTSRSSARRPRAHTQPRGDEVVAAPVRKTVRALSQCRDTRVVRQQWNRSLVREQRTRTCGMSLDRTAVLRLVAHSMGRFAKAKFANAHGRKRRNACAANYRHPYCGERLSPASFHPRT